MWPHKNDCYIISSIIQMVEKSQCPSKKKPQRKVLRVFRLFYKHIPNLIHCMLVCIKILVYVYIYTFSKF
jgi:hypothetical protein